MVDTDFARDQLRYPRVRAARNATLAGIEQLYRERGIEYPAAEIFLRVFKRERVLELWVRPTGASQFALLREYRICALAGEVGPKRRQGDNMTPEGFYEIDAFNPNSAYHLSLRVNYPNAADRRRGGSGPLGGDIFIHGGCKTAGCIAVTDESIKELYWIAVEARARGQRRIPVHIFPSRLTTEELALLKATFPDRPDLLSFWHDLGAGYAFFERFRVPPLVTVDAAGRYRVTAPATSPVLPAISLVGFSR